jgi:hypothetical protein
LIGRGTALPDNPDAPQHANNPAVERGWAVDHQRKDDRGFYARAGADRTVAVRTQPQKYASPRGVLTKCPLSLAAASKKEAANFGITETGLSPATTAIH